MEIYTSKHLGYCFGVKRAIELAEKSGHPMPVHTYGDIIHNDVTIERLKKQGINAVQSVDDVTSGTLIIRTHGAAKDVVTKAETRGLNVIDATCPFVKKIHAIVREHYINGYQIAIVGRAEHPEVIGINSYCDFTAQVLEDETAKLTPDGKDKLCLVAQTTYNSEKFHKIVENIPKEQFKTVEIFDTICYTALERQKDASMLAKKCDVMLVIGSLHSSNTVKLKEICYVHCPRTYLVTSPSVLKKINIKNGDKIGIVAGASTPDESITEVIQYMSDNTFTEKAQDKDFLEEIQQLGEGKKPLRAGKKMRVKVTFADDKGITVNVDRKVDGFISANEAVLDDEEYSPENFTAGTEIDAILLNAQAVDGVYLLSKKQVDELAEADKVVDEIRDGQIFELVALSETKGGVLGKLGSYTVFVPASQIKERYVQNVAQYVGKTLRLVCIEINDEKKRIVATQKKVLEEERKAREEMFWDNVKPGIVVSGKVKGTSKFGAFVSIDGFDCLVHISDISWAKFKTIEDVLKIGKKYDFVVLKADREKNKVSLGYKQLQKHPFDLAVEEFPVGSTTTGKITSILPFGLFVEIKPGVEGLVHVSEASRQFIKDLNESYKVGNEVEVKLLAVDGEARKITLSIKACLPEESESEAAASSKEKRERVNQRGGKKSAETKSEGEWSENDANNPFADLADLLKSND